MLLDRDKLLKMVSDMKAKGFDVGLRDICYALLKDCFEDHSFPYRALWGDNAKPSVETYEKDKKVKAIQELLDALNAEAKKEQAILKGERIEDKKGEDVSFDELKQGLIEDLRSLESLRDSVDKDGVPTLEPKEMATVVNQISSIRIRLVEKFSVSERAVEQRVIVQNKFNSVCPYCHHEIAIDPSLKLKV